MTFLDKLNAARDSAISAYHVFLLKYSETNNDIHAFFEGYEDSSFYTHVIRRIAGTDRKIHPYQCGSKKNVYDAFQSVSAKAHKNSVILFFVDKDLADILGEVYIDAPNIYTTDYYSIENYLVSEEMLEIVWQDIFRFKESTINFEVIKEQYNKEYAKFCALMVSIMAWIVYMRKSNQKLNLNNASLSRLYEINNNMFLEISEEAKDRGEIPLLEIMCNTTTPNEFWKTHEETKSKLQMLKPKVYIRGKFELWFFIGFIKRLAELLRSMDVKSKTQLSEGNAVEFLGPRTIPPQSLIDFLTLNV